ncbi:MAG TPA: hypothetical protein VFR58_07045 [Flavisolibacter sp.]|nr:hypothetical protein [Flavisolibacter sp.]
MRKMLITVTAVGAAIAGMILYWQQKRTREQVRVWEAEAFKAVESPAGGFFDTEEIPGSFKTVKR